MRTWWIAATLIAALAVSSAALADEGGSAPKPGVIAPSTPSGGQPGAVPYAVPDVPNVPPDIYSQKPPPGLPHRYGASASPGQFAPPPPPGPVTGYGPGGLGAAPGAPANPPFSFGGLNGRPR